MSVYVKLEIGLAVVMFMEVAKHLAEYIKYTTFHRVSLLSLLTASINAPGNMTFEPMLTAAIFPAILS